MAHACLKCTCNEKLAFPLFVSNNGLHMFLELNVHKLSYKLNENNKPTKDHFHMWETNVMV